MCKKHREKLEEAPKTAVIIWYRLIQLAKDQMQAHEWQRAIISYGNALDAAQISFSSNSNSTEVNRYIRTAAELIYVIRLCRYPCDIENIFEIVKSNLKEVLYPADITFLIRPLIDISHSPFTEVDRWMKMLYLYDQQKSHVYH